MTNFQKVLNMVLDKFESFNAVYPLELRYHF